MQEKLIRPILYVSGAVTMLAGAQFAAPGLVLHASGMAVSDSAGLFYAQHWGLMALVVGALLVCAARRQALRRPVMLAAGVEKLGFVALVLGQWSNPALQGLHLAVPFDATCVLLYLIYLLRAGRA